MLAASSKNVKVGAMPEKGHHDHDELEQRAVSPKLNSKAIWSVILAYLSIFTFGVDTNAFGLVNVHPDFVQVSCVKPGFGDQISCGLDLAMCEKFTTQENGTYASICYSTADNEIAPDQCCNSILQSNAEWKGYVYTLFNLLIQIGAIASALTVAPWLAEKYGRVMSIRVGSVVVLIGSLFQSYLAFDLFWVMCLGRIVLGFGAGLQVYAVPLYGAEMANAKYRGLAIGLFQVFTVLASFMCALIVAIPTLADGNQLSWELVQFLAAFPTPITFIGSFFMSPSPRYIMSKQGFDAGYETLKTIRKEDCREEADQMWQGIEAEADMVPITYKEALTLPNISTRTWTCIIMNAFQQLTGVNILIGLAPSFWIQAGLPAGLSDWVGVIQSGVFLVFATFGYVSLDTIGGRRIQYLLGTIVLIIASILITAGAAVNSGMIVLIGSMVVFGMGFQTSHGIIAWAYPAEVFSMRERKTVGNLSCVSQWTTQLIFVGMGNYFLNATNLTIGGPIFLIFNTIGLVWIWFYVEETKGVAIEDVPLLFEDTPRGHWPLKIRDSSIKSAETTSKIGEWACSAEQPHLEAANV